jgi:isopropylmalate/homocitrate/citramalate synthase
MLKKNMYPICAESFRKWYLSNETYKKFYQNLGTFEIFDVTLRDGLQGLTREEQETFTIIDKLKIYNNIKFKYEPKNIEVGSFVSEKVLPVFKDTLSVLKFVDTYTENINNFIVIPNKNKFSELLNEHPETEVNNISLITSVSNSFQLKNTKMSLEVSDSDIRTILTQLANYKNKQKVKPNVKLYVSCINECPIEGKIDNDFIVHRLLNLSKMKVDNICLSDTCGTLTLEDFEYIIDTCFYFGLQPSRLSLHLHINSERESFVEEIFFKALEYKIYKFDLSNINTGGCSVTMKKEQLSPNLSYELYYKYLCNYIIKKSL